MTNEELAQAFDRKADIARQALKAAPSMNPCLKASVEDSVALYEATAQILRRDNFTLTLMASDLECHGCKCAVCPDTRTCESRICDKTLLDFYREKASKEAV